MKNVYCYSLNDILDQLVISLVVGNCLSQQTVCFCCACKGSVVKTCSRIISQYRFGGFPAGHFSYGAVLCECSC